MSFHGFVETAPSSAYVVRVPSAPRTSSCCPATISNRPSGSRSRQNGIASMRVTSSRLPSGSTASTSPAPQSEKISRSSCQRGDSTRTRSLRRVLTSDMLNRPRRRHQLIGYGLSISGGFAWQIKHPLQRGLGVALSLRIDCDLVDDMALRQVLQGPNEMRQVDPIHCGAVTDVLLQKNDLLVGMIMSEALDQVELGADSPLRPRLCLLDGLDDELCGADQIRLQDDLMLALWMHQHIDTGDSCPHVADGLMGEPSMHRAMAFPQDHRSGLHFARGEATVVLVGVVDHAIVQAHAHLEHRGVATEMLIGQEQHLLAALKSPLEYRLGV